MMGVGLPLLPIMYQQAGFLVPTIVILFVAVFSGLAGNMLAEAMKYLPNNRDFEDRIEYSSLAKFYLGKWPYVLTQIILNLSLLSLNLVSILLTVQVMDWTLVAIFKCTYGVSIAPNPAAWSVCHAVNSTVIPNGNSPFPQGEMIIR
jgi:amino acid permease